MATPTYDGAGQPGAGRATGWLAQLGAYFGVPTPAYATPPATTGDPIKATPPIAPSEQAPLPVAVLVPSPCGDGVTPIAIDPAALADGAIAIVVPRDRG